MNDVGNDKYVQACKEIFDIYNDQISLLVKTEKDTLHLIKQDIEREKNRINASDEFCLKVKYVLGNIGKFFAVTVLGVDSGYVPFDTYKYYKIQKTGIVDGKGSVQLEYLKNIYNECNGNVDFFIKLHDMISSVKNKIVLSPQLSSDFFYRLSNKSNDANFYYRLFEVLEVMGFDIKEVYDMAKGGHIDNDKSHSPAVDKLNACVAKYNIENNKSLKR